MNSGFILTNPPTTDTTEPVRLRPRVLIVDDDPYVLPALARTLGQAFDVTAVLGSLNGVKIVREAETPFHVVISDLRMPHVSGIGLLQCVRQASPRTLRILLTGYADVPAALAAVNSAEVFRFLTKPCKPEVLLATVAEACRRYEASTEPMESRPEENSPEESSPMETEGAAGG